MNDNNIISNQNFPILFVERGKGSYISRFFMLDQGFSSIEPFILCLSNNKLKYLPTYYYYTENSNQKPQVGE